MTVRKSITPLVCLFAFVWAAYVIKHSSPDASTGKAVEQRSLLVETQVLSSGEYSLSIASYGRVQAKHRSELHALVSGQVLRVSPSFKAGGHVSKGDTVLYLDSSEYVLAVQEARSNLAQAELALADETARSEQARRDWGSRSRNTEASDFTLRVPQLRASKEYIRTAHARLKLAQLNLERCEVKAPGSGRIQTTHVEQGSVVNPGVLLATGYDTSAAEVRLAVSAEALKYLKVPGSNARPEDGSVVLFTNNLVTPPEVWRGRIVRSEAAIDSETQQLYVVAEIEQPFSGNATTEGSKRPIELGQYLDAEIIGATLTGAIGIPSSSIYQGSYVHLYDSGQLRKREVTVLWRSGTNTIVSDGLSAGDELIVTPLGQVSSGTLVRRGNETQKSKASDMSGDPL